MRSASMRRADALSAGDRSRIIEMAWQDHTPFEALELQFGLNESAVIALMRASLKRSSFRLWRQRVSGRRSKHQQLDLQPWVSADADDAE